MPGIHRSTKDTNTDVELIHAFTMKLKPTIAKELLSRNAAFPDLTAVIEAAKRYEAVDSVMSAHEPPEIRISTPNVPQGRNNYRNRNNRNPQTSNR